MGFYEIKENTVLNIRDLGLKIGDNLIVYCVGGGGGGGASVSDAKGHNAGSDNYTGCVLGFGASGGGAKSSSGSPRFCQAGAVGNLVSAVITLEEEEIAVTIGDRGLGGNNASTSVGNGGNGGTTSFGSYVTATGGKGGRYGGNHSKPSYQFGNGDLQRGRFGFIAPAVFATVGDVFDKKLSGQGVVWLYW